MLILRRRLGDWLEVVHRSGDVLWIKVNAMDLTDDGTFHVNLAFKDDDKFFTINRPERGKRKAEGV